MPSLVQPRTLGALSLIGALALLAAPSPLLSQEHDHDDDDGPHVVTWTGRPRIGVMVDSRANAETDRYGARLAEVTKDGPAAKAGLQAGDIITRFNGVALGGLKGGDDEASGPGARLVELARKLDAGDTVQVEYRRDGQSRNATIVASDLSGMVMREFRMRVPGPEGMGMGPGEMPRPPFPPGDGPRAFMYEGGPDNFNVFLSGRAMGLRLADLNPDLGEYFGTKAGALVLETPRDSTLPLRAGDVILSIDGRSVQDADGAHRILRSYAGGETAKLEVQRKQRKVSLTWKAPEGREMRWRTPEGGEMRQRTPAPRARVRVERS